VSRALALVIVSLGALAACNGGGTATPSTPTLTTQAPVIAAPAAGVTRFIVGGDSRDDHSHVIPWAFGEAKTRGASAFIFLGDMALTPQLAGRFQQELELLGTIPFYPTLGNHEVRQFGLIAIDKSRYERKFRERFLDNTRTPVTSSVAGKVVYSVDLPAGVHFVALDNVSQKGFGATQLTWLEADLTAANANPAVKYIIVGMHEPLARNGVVMHGMDRDGAQAIADSDAALTMFQLHHVAMIFVSHDHRFASFTQGGIPSYITGGLGAPLDTKADADAFHHFLQLDVAPDGLHVTVVKFEGPPSIATEPDDD
jgi:hypothetical protein